MNFELIPGWDARPHHVVTARAFSSGRWEWKPSMFGDLYSTESSYIPIFLKDSDAPFFYQQLLPATTGGESTVVEAPFFRTDKRSILFDEEGHRYLKVEAYGTEYSSDIVAKDAEQLLERAGQSDLDIGTLVYALASGDGLGTEYQPTAYYIRLNPNVENNYALRQWQVPDDCQVFELSEFRTRFRQNAAP